MNSVTLGIFKFLWPWVVVAVMWRAEASLQRIDRVHLMTEPGLCLRAGLPVHDGQCVMDASLSWRFPTGRQVVRSLEAEKPGRPLTLTPNESGSLSYGYNPGDLHSVGGTPAVYGLLVLALGIALLPFANDIRSLFNRSPSASSSSAGSWRR